MSQFSIPSIAGIFAVLICTICLYSCRTTTEYVGGIQINEFNQDSWARTLKASGMNTAQVTAYAKQGAWNSDHLWWEPTDTTYIIQKIRTLKGQGVKVVLVLRVALQHEFEPNSFKWHGMIFPTSRAQQNEWFHRYNYFVEMWSQICDREGVDVLSIASEMSALTATLEIDELPPLIEHFSNKEKQLEHELKIVPYENQLQQHELWEYGKKVNSSIRQYILNKTESNVQWTRDAFHTDQANAISIINENRKYLDSTWRAIIANARKYYDGKLTMAANYDSYNEVSFWDDLDFIGINAYFPLRTMSRKPISDDSLYLELVHGWEKVFTDISDFKTTHGLKNKPIFFTEIGYTKKQDCTVAPWKGDGYSFVSNDEFDTLLIWENVSSKPEERVMALNALHQVVRKEKTPLIGLNYWKLTSHAFHEGYEPFMLLIKEEEADELQSALTQFL